MLLAMDADCVLFDPLTDELFACEEDVNEFHQAYTSAHPELFSRLRGDAAN